ncbi:mediator of RNA polymerase II transcription subunit 27-like [Dendronephthya gigantea]|uniref:mediator of RNA polymerase II transcription subunit 27-like n=1 Tax=Dendronephthya gigantea TaxID=151771 RepID=UPI00106B7A38|nr:mediator of RNA polymerase II transcription subunit 27-like [Dendronephthya gigantea]
MAANIEVQDLAASEQFSGEKEKYKLALSTTRDIRNLVDSAFENAIKDFAPEKTKLKENLVKLEKKLSDLEKIGNSLTKLDNQHTLLGKSGLLWSDPIQDKTPLYDQLMQTYSWTQKLNSQAKIASESLKRHHILDGDSFQAGAKRRLRESLFVPQSTLKQIVEQLKKSFPKLTIRWNKIAGVSLLEVSVKLTLNAIIILRGCTIDRVMIKAIHETSEDKDEFMQCSKYKTFNKMTDVANAAAFHYSQCGDPKKSLNSLLNWLTYYEKLFSEKCTKCKKHLQNDIDRNVLPPCWIDFETLKLYHLQCKP